MNVSVALDYSTDSEICNETEVSHRPITVLEASEGDPEGERVTNTLVESQTTSASSQSNSSQSTTPAPLPRSKRLVTYVSATQKHEQCTQTEAILDPSLLAVVKIENKVLKNETQKREQCTQTEAILDPSPLAVVKIENKVLKNETPNLNQRLEECQREKVTDNFCVNDVTDDDEKCKFYTDLTWMQFMSMWNFLGSCKDKLIYWNQPLKNGDTSASKWPGAGMKLSPMDELFHTLVRLRLGLLNADMSYWSGVSTIVASLKSWLQFVTLHNRMFPSRAILKLNMPPCFAKFKDIRVIIDYCEFFCWPVDELP